MSIYELCLCDVSYAADVFFRECVCLIVVVVVKFLVQMRRKLYMHVDEDEDTVNRRRQKTTILLVFVLYSPILRGGVGGGESGPRRGGGGSLGFEGRSYPGSWDLSASRGGGGSSLLLHLKVREWYFLSFVTSYCTCYTCFVFSSLFHSFDQPTLLVSCLIMASRSFRGSLLVRTP
jgi:hypothetical protein